MTDSNATELLPCPFCGGEAHHFGGAGQHCIRCSKCGKTNERMLFEKMGAVTCYTAFDTAEEAYADWNRRAAVTDYDFAMAVHDGNLWGKCSECTDRDEYAEMVREQRESIRSLEIQLDAITDFAKLTQADCDHMEALVRDCLKLMGTWDRAEWECSDVFSPSDEYEPEGNYAALLDRAKEIGVVE